VGRVLLINSSLQLFVGILRMRHLYKFKHKLRPNGLISSDLRLASSHLSRNRISALFHTRLIDTLYSVVSKSDWPSIAEVRLHCVAH